MLLRHLPDARALPAALGASSLPVQPRTLCFFHWELPSASRTGQRGNERELVLRLAHICGQQWRPWPHGEHPRSDGVCLASKCSRGIWHHL